MPAFGFRQHDILSPDNFFKIPTNALHDASVVPLRLTSRNQHSLCKIIVTIMDGNVLLFNPIAIEFSKASASDVENMFVYGYLAD